MKKNFDKWNKEKKKADELEVRRDLFLYEREVWWCTLGVNIGVETDGKNENYERPVLIVKKFNNAMLADFHLVMDKIIKYITIGPRISAGSSEAEATNE